MIVGGVILLIIAVICFFIARSQAGKLHAMNAVDTYTSQMLTDLHGRVVGSLGSDALAEPCEVEGIIECDAPLQAPISGTPCVVYKIDVVREYEEDVTTTNSEGRTETRTQKGTETVESNEQKVDFWVRDATGRSLIRPERADLDLKESGQRYQPVNVAPGSQLDLGFMQITVPALQGRRRTLGYRTTEQILETGINVYVLGCVGDYNGQPAVMVSPRDKKQKFMVSRRTERELAASAAATSRNLYFAAAGTGVLGALLLVLGILT